MATRMSMGEYNQRLKATSDDSAKHDALYEVHERVRQLEALNALLAEQVDRMQPVVDAARTVPVAGNLGQWCMWFARVVQGYDAQVTRLTKESSNMKSPSLPPHPSVE